MISIPDQRPIWDKKHTQGDHEELRGKPSPLAEIAELYFPASAYILELGCGVGRDAVMFASKDHRVLATDGSEVVIEQNAKLITKENVSFRALDMREPFPYGNNSFDVVYANLSLHYYSEQKTTEIANEIARVLKSGGIFAFACKSYDSLHGDGEEIDRSVFASPSGATIHFFSEEYARSILEPAFEVMLLDEVEEVYKGRQSRIVRCIARKV